jgi:hypothetical protein
VAARVARRREQRGAGTRLVRGVDGRAPVEIGEGAGRGVAALLGQGREGDRVARDARRGPGLEAPHAEADARERVGERGRGLVARAPGGDRLAPDVDHLLDEGRGGAGGVSD